MLNVCTAVALSSGERHHFFEDADAVGGDKLHSSK